MRSRALLGSLREAVARWAPDAARSLLVVLGPEAAAHPLTGLAVAGHEFWRTEDPQALAFPDAACDLILVPEFPGDLRWPRWALQEMGRVLAPGGRLLLVAGRPGLAGRLCPPGSPAGQLLRRLGVASAEAMTTRELRRLLAGLGYALDAEEPVDRRRRLIVAHRPVATDRPQLLAALAATRGEARSRRRRRRRSLARWLAAHPEFARPELRPLAAHFELDSPTLVLAPHPDDELVGCGGALLAMRAAGAPVSILLLTDGSATAALREAPPAQRSSVRLEEAGRVAAALGAQLECWGEPDGSLVASEALVDRLARRLDALRPRVIFTPPPFDPHPDHAATAALLRAALGRSVLDPAALSIVCYEVWTAVPANALLDVEPLLDAKARLLMEHRHGMMVVDYIRESRRVELEHSLQLRGRSGFLEAFLVVDGRQFMALSG